MRTKSLQAAGAPSEQRRRLQRLTRLASVCQPWRLTVRYISTQDRFTCLLPASIMSELSEAIHDVRRCQLCEGYFSHLGPIDCINTAVYLEQLEP